MRRTTDHPTRRRPSIREAVDRELRTALRRDMLGSSPLPTPRWKRVHSGHARPAGILAELGRDARLDAHRTAPDVRAGLVAFAHRVADAIEQSIGRAA